MPLKVSDPIRGAPNLSFFSHVVEWTILCYDKMATVVKTCCDVGNKLGFWACLGVYFSKLTGLAIALCFSAENRTFVPLTHFPWN